MTTAYTRTILMGIAAALLCASAWAVEGEKKAASTVIPRPKTLDWREGAFPLRLEPVIAISDSQPEAGQEARWLAERLTKELELRPRIENQEQAQGAITLRTVKKLEGVPDGVGQDEGYRLEIRSNGVLVEACTGRGLFYGIQSLFDLIRHDSNGWTIPACELRDWPDFGKRGLLVAPGQAVMTINDLKYRIDQMAASKLNVMHAHLTDEGLFAPKLSSYPVLSGSDQDPSHCYTAEQIRDLVAYADRRKIEIIPEISMPAHATRIVRLLPELRCKPENGAPPSTWAMCIGTEDTYTFIDRVVTELGPLFTSPLFHIGTDELEFLDMPDAPIRISWRECTVCRERMKKEGLKDERALFYYFIQRTNDIMKKRGKRLMMWNDQIDIGKPDEVTIPKDVLIHFWRIAAPGRGPVENCTYEAFLKKGFQVVNSYYPETYIDFYMTDDKLRQWNPYTVPEAPEAYRAQVLGGFMCAWSGHDMYRRALPSAIPFFADRVWNVAPIDDPAAFSHALPRHIFGPWTPEGELDGLYDALGGMIPPLGLEPDKKARPETSLPGQEAPKKVEEYRRLIAVIDREIAAGRVRFVPALQAYRESLEWLIAQSGGV